MGSKVGQPANSLSAGPFSHWERVVAARYIRPRRKEVGVALIAALAFLGISLAVLTLIIVMSVMGGFRTELLGRILGFNGHLYVAGPVLSASNRDQAVTNIRAVPGVIQAIPLVEAQAMAIGRGQIAGAIVRGITPQDLKATSIVSKNIKTGSMDGFGEGEEGGGLVLIGRRLADSLGVEAGDSISLISPSGAATAFGSSPNQKDYVVGGVFEVGMSDYDQTYIYMPLQQAQLFFGRDASVDVIEIKVTDPDNAPAIKPAIQRAAGSGAMVSDWTEKNEAFFTALQVERNTMRLILMLQFVTAALLIVSSLIMLVKNRSHDIAILRTMGASRGAILRIFLMAGGAIGVTGSACGLFWGVVFCLNIEQIQKFVEWVTGTSVFSEKIYFLTHIPARIEWSDVSLTVGWAVLISLLASLLPAIWASRLDPVEALRYE